jgi:hypothetical protein
MPAQTAMTVLLAGRKYIDWLPYDNTLREAEIFFHNTLPFGSLSGNEKQVIKSLHLTRNAIAHKSTHAIRVFDNEVIGSAAVTRVERTPSRFLQSNFRTAPRQNRYENFVYEMASIARKLTR